MAKPIILIHGAWHAKWCWKKMVPLLTKPDYQIIDIDLPGHGANQKIFEEISLSTYVDYLSHIIKDLPKPVVLVGHSLAGVIISQVAERIPHAIDKLIYVTAFIPENGSSLADEAKKSVLPGISTELLIDLKTNESDLKKTQRLNELFYNMCSEDDIRYTTTMLQKEPYSPFFDKIRVTESKFGKVRKCYIACDNDNTVLIEDQKRMYNQHGVKAFHIQADHSPFFSAPEVLAETIWNCLNDWAMS